MNMALKSGSSGAKADKSQPAVLAFVPDSDTLDAICRVVPGARRGVEVREGGIADAATTIQLASPPSLLIVDVTDTASPASDMAGLKATCGDATTIIALGPDNDVGLYRSLISAGATDYLVKPITGQELRRTILSISHTEMADEEKRSGRIVVVIGARGGAGASSLAAGIAWLLAHEFGRHAALVDLDLHFGTAALSFDVDPGNGLRNALEDPERIDSLLVASALVNCGDNLYILGGEEPIDEAVHIDTEALGRLLEELRQVVDTVVIDLPRHRIANNIDLLSAADGIALVTDLSIAGLRDAMRIRKALERSVGHPNFKIVANRMGHARGGELNVAEFEKSLEAKIDFQIHEVPQAAKAALDGKPLTAGLKHKASGAAVRALTTTLAQVAEVDGPKQRGWLGLLGKLKQ